MTQTIAMQSIKNVMASEAWREERLGFLEQY